MLSRAVRLTPADGHTRNLHGTALQSMVARLPEAAHAYAAAIHRPHAWALQCTPAPPPHSVYCAVDGFDFEGTCAIAAGGPLDNATARKLTMSACADRCACEVRC